MAASGYLRHAAAPPLDNHNPRGRYPSHQDHRTPPAMAGRGGAVIFFSRGGEAGTRPAMRSSACSMAQPSSAPRWPATAQTGCVPSRPTASARHHAHTVRSSQRPVRSHRPCSTAADAAPDRGAAGGLRPRGPATRVAVVAAADLGVPDRGAANRAAVLGRYRLSRCRSRARRGGQSRRRLRGAGPDR
jgi:hypothetical protein